MLMQVIFTVSTWPHLSYIVENLEKEVSSHPDPSEGLSQRPSQLKEEVRCHDGASVKHEVRLHLALIQMLADVMY